MRGLASLVALVAGLLVAAPAAADPGDVYVDYASDGTLSCGHSRADLEGILTDASVNEYGDPLTLLRLKIAVRRQLNGGCEAAGGAPAEPGSPAASPSTQADGPGPLTEGGDAEPTPVEEGSADGTTTEAATTEAVPPPSGTTAAEASPAGPASTEEAPETAAVAAAVGDDDDGGGTGTAAAPLILALGAGAAALAGAGLLARRALTRDG
jgi:hypothetical protein